MNSRQRRYRRRHPCTHPRAETWYGMTRCGYRMWEGRLIHFSGAPGVITACTVCGERLSVTLDIE